MLSVSEKSRMHNVDVIEILRFAQDDMRVLFQNQLFCLSKGIISGQDNQIAGLQTFGHFVLLWILATDGQRYTDGLVLRGIDLVNPLSASGLIEITARHNQGVFGLAKLDLYAEALAHTNILRHLASEDQIDIEHAVLHDGHYLGNLQWILLALVVDGGGKASSDAIDVILAQLGMNLELVEHLDFTDGGI